MLLTDEELKYCFDKTRDIAEQYAMYHIAADDPRRSVDNLRLTCEAYLKVKIELREMHVPRATSAVVAAFFSVGAGVYHVAYVQDLPHDRLRLVVCKELFHVILDCEEFHNMDLTAHVEEVTVAFPDHHSNPGPSVKAELLAELAAMEFLFPYHLRLQELAGEGKTNFRAIAEKYGVPQVNVEHCMHPSYMEIMKKYCGVG